MKLMVVAVQPCQSLFARYEALGEDYICDRFQIQLIPIGCES